MDAADDEGHVLHRFPPDENTVDRLLSGAIHPDDAPPELALVAELLRSAVGPATFDELRDERSIVDSITAAIAHGVGPDERDLAGVGAAVGDGGAEAADQVRHEPVFQSPSRRMSMLKSLIVGKIAIASTVGVIALSTVAAAAGTLPDPVQGVMSSAFSHVGVSLPDPDAELELVVDGDGEGDSEVSQESEESTSTTAATTATSATTAATATTATTATTVATSTTAATTSTTKPMEAGGSASTPTTKHDDRDKDEDEEGRSLSQTTSATGSQVSGPQTTGPQTQGDYGGFARRKICTELKRTDLTPEKRAILESDLLIAAARDGETPEAFCADPRAQADSSSSTTTTIVVT